MCKSCTKVITLAMWYIYIYLRKEENIRKRKKKVGDGYNYRINISISLIVRQNEKDINVHVLGIHVTYGIYPNHIPTTKMTTLYVHLKLIKKEIWKGTFHVHILLTQPLIWTFIYIYTYILWNLHQTDYEIFILVHKGVPNYLLFYFFF